MPSDIAKAAARDDVYELVELSYRYKGEPEKLAEVAAALEESIPRLDPVTHGRELAYVVKAPEFPELATAREAAQGGA